MDIMRVAITGAQGRMGLNLIRAAQKEHINLRSVLVKPGSTLIGHDAGELIGINKIGIQITDNIYNIIDHFDCLIDFTNKKSTLANLNICHKYRKSMVIGTTGFNQEDYQLINRLSNDIPIILSANFSIGMNVVLKLLEKTAKIIGNNSDIEIIEAHHCNKIDAPSGTALTMGKTIANIMNWEFDQHAIYSRKGIIGKRQKKSIGFSVIRAGDIIGEHTAMFSNIGERIEITHRVSDRMNFALGAMKATKWLQGKKYGFFNMWDVLGLSSV
ncbi:4-hydroxy-tetrahydrodipicolinate reductase [Candidatus Pantoea edessiphila]|uniref:4-hydroxy-tetrahydrodipicolinate reductase n=1 Tax=Candidatus Pantoea edessiphila TaxID=2044610 RepID=A0A2P5SY31_9GAMM|nr:4-hydroxy-tetrahydrodipicolinate reductase [Candidatus Pantoea edessiphila]MBK4775609.1 4-hydroxy-tetrahydrodipicolinate reductase [Pantoea sp. Edef]PPI87257.1 4-hydroxy-tetrahydrodipicolinate reductase [Candidatus Pantoea edessiphila]